MNNDILFKEIKGLPFIWSAEGIMSPESFISHYLDNMKEIEAKLQLYGAIKFKEVKIDSIATFQYIVNAISTKFLSYVDGNSPRTKLTDNVYTSTEYDKTKKITMHNELSYSAKWPNKLFLSCLQPSETGGETFLADSRKILEKMDEKIVNNIREKGIVYIRNLHGGHGMGPSWQDTFETSDRDVLEAYCKSYGINFQWTDSDSLKLMQFSKGIIKHRNTDEEVWFNQIDQFHPSHLGEEVYEAIKTIYGSPEDFPMNVKFGDETEIEEDVIQQILSTINDLTIAPAWNTNELLIVDNELACHGRNSFTGDRKVVVAMSE